MAYLLGIDIGTSGTKTLICDETGHVLATAGVEHTCQSPKPGWSEQDPVQWWQATCNATRQVLKKARIHANQITGIGLSGQMHGSVFLADDTKPLRSALLWNDQRTAEQCKQITKKAGGQKKLIQMVGNPALTGFTAPKILWVREHQPKLFKQVKHVLLPKDYIRLCMTGVYRSDVSDASGTLLLDVRKRKWNHKLMQKLELDESLMPPVVESHEITGQLTQAAAKQMGLQAGIPVVGGGGDQAVGAVGNGIVQTGIVSATLGTSGVVFAHADEPTQDPQGRVHTMCSAVKDKWCVFGCMLSAAGSLQWYRNTQAQDLVEQAKRQRRDPYELLDKLAQNAPVGSESLFFLPYLTGERCPYSNPNARGSWIGLTSRHERSHIVRSLMEGVTFGMADQLNIMQQMGVKISTVRLSGGGSKSAFWRQMQADIYGIRCATINSEQGPAYGAAILAGVGTGIWPSVPNACKKIVHETQKIQPHKKNRIRYSALHKQYSRLYHALEGEYERIAKLH